MTNVRKAEWTGHKGRDDMGISSQYFIIIKKQNMSIEIEKNEKKIEIQPISCDVLYYSFCKKKLAESKQIN